MYVCMYVGMYVRMYVCMYVYMNISTIMGLLNTSPNMSGALEEFCALDLFLDAKEAKLAVKGKARGPWPPWLPP